MSKLKKRTISQGLERLNDVVDMRLSESADGTWYLALSDLPDEQVQWAFIRLIQTITSDFNRKPRPGDLRKIVEESVPDTSWSESFTWLCDNITSPYSPSPPFPDPITQRAYDQFGGMYSIIGMATEDMGTHRAQFKKIYEEILAQEKTSMARSLTAPSYKSNSLIGGKE